MNRQEIFDAWKKQKSPEDTSPEFADRVMARIRRRDTTHTRTTMLTLQSIASRPWARVAVIVVGTLLGLARIIATVHMIFFA